MIAYVRRTPSWAFVSNMYPSDRDVSYGAFVQRSYDDLCAEGFNIEKLVVIRGRTTGAQRVKAYLMHYVRLALLMFRSDLNFWYVHYASHHCLLPALAARLFSRKVVVHIHGDDLVLAKSGLYRRAMAIGQTMLFRSSSLIVVPSLFFQEILLQRFPSINPLRVIISPSSGIDFDTLHAATAGRPCYWECSSEKRIAEIGYIGRIDADKGWESLFNAFVTLPDVLKSNARLHFWGEGKESKRLRERISSEGHGSILYHGAVAFSEVPFAHACFDFHVVPSVRESLGLAALEGLGAGHVMICSEIRPFTDITCNDLSALHVNAELGRDLVSVLSKALQMSNDELSALSKNGQETAKIFDRRIVSSKLAHYINTNLIA